MNEMPQMMSCALTSSAGLYIDNTTSNTGGWESDSPFFPGSRDRTLRESAFPITFDETDEEDEEMTERRVVKVYVIDPDENVPVEKCLIYEADIGLTDKTDQELFFEISIKELLDTHNTVRTKIVDKSVKDRTEYLEPARIRDLKMVVINLATF